MLTAPMAALAQIASPEPPTLPDVAPVALDPGTTAFRARAAGVLVGYSTTPGAEVLSDVTPLSGDPVVTSRADKFFNPNLDQILSDHGVKNVLIVGSAANGAVLSTTFSAGGARLHRGRTPSMASPQVPTSTPFWPSISC
jgi:nicotinamidase-related amidase